MSIFKLLLSPKGRIPRKIFIAVALGCNLSIYFLTIWLPYLLLSSLDDTLPIIIGGILSLLLLWPLYCACAKRLHDVNRTAFWATPLLINPVLAGLIPVIVPWIIITVGLDPDAWQWIFEWPTVIATAYILLLQLVLACWPGTKGPNRFGDPDMEKALSVDSVFE
ncbi:MAG: DUF805 domain-containing protein [Asticcacaulis sp.]